MLTLTCELTAVNFNVNPTQFHANDPAAKKIIALFYFGRIA